MKKWNIDGFKADVLSVEKSNINKQKGKRNMINVNYKHMELPKITDETIFQMWITNEF